MTKSLLLALLATVSTVAAADRYLYLDAEGIHEVQPCFVDPLLRRIPEGRMEEAMQSIAVRAVKLDNGEYALRAHVRGPGGGPLAGAAAYWSVKASGYAAYGALCWVQPSMLLHVNQAVAGIELSSTYAGMLAGASPTL